MPLRSEYVILHCTDSSWGTVESVRRFHVSERGWADIGYHYLITNCYPTFESVKTHRLDLAYDGKVWKGRDLDHDGDVEEEVGAHVQGWNKKSLGVALVGTGGIFTSAQIRSAVELIRDLCIRHEIAFDRVLGHYETGAPKTCPEIEMGWFREQLRHL